MKKLRGVVFLVLSTFIGCSDDDDDDVVGKCERLAATLCGKTIDCLSATPLPASERDSQVARCVSDGMKNFSCQNVVRIGASYDACLNEVQASDCATYSAALSSGGGFVATCSNVLLLQ